MSTGRWSMSEEIKNFSKKTQKEVKWWSYAAWTLPFTALSGLFFFYALGWEDLYHKSLWLGGVIFFSVSVFWWWWAIHKIARTAKIIISVTDKFSEVKKELERIKDSFKKI